MLIATATVFMSLIVLATARSAAAPAAYYTLPHSYLIDRGKFVSNASVILGER